MSGSDQAWKILSEESPPPPLDNKRIKLEKQDLSFKFNELLNPESAIHSGGIVCSILNPNVVNHPVTLTLIGIDKSKTVIDVPECGMNILPNLCKYLQKQRDKMVAITKNEDELEYGIHLLDSLIGELEECNVIYNH